MGERRKDSGEGHLINSHVSPIEALKDQIRKQGKGCKLTFTHPHRSHQSGETHLFDSMSKEGKK